jgi:hypothetical protein
MPVFLWRESPQLLKTAIVAGFRKERCDAYPFYVNDYFIPYYVAKRFF